MISGKHLSGMQQTPAQWSDMFCGSMDPQCNSSLPLKCVCLHKEKTQIVVPEVSFDVDSFLGFLTSLAVARHGLLYQPSPQARQNLTTDVHIGLDVSEPGAASESGASFTTLREVPHLFLGRLAGSENVAIYVFFPYLEASTGTSILTTA